MSLTFGLWFTGGGKFSSQVSQTSLPIFYAVGFWKQCYSLRRRRVEKVPNSYRPSLLGGMYLLSKSPFVKRDPQRNTRLVWDETTRIMFDLFDNVWGDKPEIVLDHCLDITLPVGQALDFTHTLSDVSFRSPFLSSVLQVDVICSSFSLSPFNWMQDSVAGSRGHQT